MSCSRYFLKATLYHRLFMIFDRDKPYTLCLIYKRRIPKRTGGSGIGIRIVGNISITDVGKINFKKERTVRVKSKEEAQEIIENILKMNFCYKCQKPGKDDTFNRYTFENCKKKDMLNL